MVKLKNRIQFTDIEDTEVAQTVDEFADLSGYENGDSILVQTFLESDEVEDAAKDYFIEQCQHQGFDPEDTVILYSW